MKMNKRLRGSRSLEEKEVQSIQGQPLLRDTSIIIEGQLGLDIAADRFIDLVWDVQMMAFIFSEKEEERSSIESEMKEKLVLRPVKEV